MKIISNEILQLYVKMKNIQFSVNPGREKKNIRKKLKNQYSQSFEIYIKRERANCKYLIIRMNLKKKENV